MELNRGLARAKEPSPQASAAADAINALPRDRRAAEVKKWRWSKDDGPDSDDEKNFCSHIQEHRRVDLVGDPFHCSKQYWEDLGADTEVEVEITEGELPDAPAGATIAADDVTAKVQGADELTA